MMKDSIFSARRFARVLRKEIALNGRGLLLMAVGMYGGLLMVMLLGNLLFSGNYENSVDIMANIVVFVIASFVFSVMASMAFGGLKSKGGRVDLLMMPATALEKVLVQAFVYVLATAVVFVFCAQLADLTRVGLMNLLMPTAEIPGPINFVTFPFGYAKVMTTGDARLAFALLMTVALMSSMSFYFMGAVLWPRYTWLKMTVASQVIQMVFLMVGAIALSFTGLDWLKRLLEVNGDVNVCRLLTALALVQTVVCAVLAYEFFKRKDVITRGII